MAHKFGPREQRASLYVRNIPYSIRRSELEEVFSRYGEIRDVYIPLDYYTREPRGFAYVEFEDERDAKAALRELDGVRHFGTTIHIEWAKSDRKTPKQMRMQSGSGGGSRGYRGGPPRGYSGHSHHSGHGSSYHNSGSNHNNNNSGYYKSSRDSRDRSRSPYGNNNSYYRSRNHAESRSRSRSPYNNRYGRRYDIILIYLIIF